MASKRRERQRTHVVKVQTDLSGHGTVLIYSKNRDLVYHGPVDETVQAAMGEQERAFFRATVRKDKFLVLEEQLPEQGW